MRGVWRAAGGLAPHRSALLGVGLLLTVEAVLPGASLLLLEDALATAGRGEVTGAARAAAGLFAVTAVASVAKLARTALSKGVAWGLTERLRLAVHKRLLEGALHERTVGDRLALLGAEIDQVQLGVSAAVTVLRDPLALLGLVAAALWMAPGLALWAALVLGPVALVAWGSTRWVARAARQEREARAGLLGLGGEQLHGREVVLAHDALDGEGDRFAEAAAADRRARWFLDVVRGVPGALTQTLGVGALGLVLVGGVVQVRNGGLEASAMLAFSAGLFLALRPLTGLAEAGSLYRRSRAALERVDALLDGAPPTWLGHEGEAESPGLVLAGACLGDAVGPIAIDVTPGQWVVVMGATGSGKTTVLRWWAGLQVPDRGQVRVHGRAPEQVPPGERRTAYVPQDSVLFARTIRENVALGAPDGDVASALVHMAAAGLDPEQVLGTLGAPLSGGERQRLALARAWLLDRPVWLLDEPTAHLDGVTRDQVVDALDALRVGRTVVVATHDPALARRADRVVVLEDGRVVQDGPPRRVLPQRVGA